MENENLERIKELEQELKKYKEICDYFRDDIVDFIDENWTDNCSEKMNKKEAIYYLGMSESEGKIYSKEELNEMVSEIQKEYYTNGSEMGATLDEICEKFIEMQK